MQTVYVDTLLCVNLFIDYIILYTVRKLLKINTKAIRLLPAALLGAVLTLGVFLPFYTRLFSVVYRVLTALAVVLTAFGIGSVKALAVRVLAFMGISIGFSGAVTLIWFIFKPNGIIVWGDTVYFDISPIMLIASTLTAYICLALYERIKSKVHPIARLHSITVFTESGTYTFSSMEDSGCSLKEPFSGLPVIIAEQELLSKEDIPDCKLRLVPFKTLSGEGLLHAFKPIKTEIDGKELESGCYIAISNKKLTGEIKSLMGKEITEGL